MSVGKRHTFKVLKIWPFRKKTNPSLTVRLYRFWGWKRIPSDVGNIKSMDTETSKISGRSVSCTQATSTAIYQEPCSYIELRHIGEIRPSDKPSDLANPTCWRNQSRYTTMILRWCCVPVVLSYTSSSTLVQSLHFTGDCRPHVPSTSPALSDFGK